MTLSEWTGRLLAGERSDRTHAMRVSLGLLVPGLFLVVVGRPEWIIYAAFGSFTGMYGRADSGALRLLHQSQGALMLLTGSALGVVLAAQHAHPGLVIVAATLFAVGGSLVADFFALRPEGPFYGIFALGALAGVPASLAPHYEGWFITSAAALLALVIGLFGPEAPAQSGRRLHLSVREQRMRERPAAVLHALRYALAVAAAGTIALASGLSHVNWAIAGAAVTLAAADPQGQLRRGLHRVSGTLAGLVVTTALLVPHLPSRWLGLLVIVSLFPTELFMSVNYALALSFFTPMIMVMTELADPIGLKELLTTRAVGTLIGVACGVLVAYSVPDRRPPATSDTMKATTGSTTGVDEELG